MVYRLLSPIGQRMGRRSLCRRVLILGLGVGMLCGCSKLRPKPAAIYVYVTARQTFLRDRVAAVSNRTGVVANGDKLEVLDHARHFYRVKTDKGELGWIEEKSVATQDVYDGFAALEKNHQGHPAVASGVTRDLVNLHLKPGKTAETFYQLPEGDKIELLERATLPKAIQPGSVQAKPGAAKPASKIIKPDPAPAPIAMEDWWLVRDAQGRAGWLLSRMMDVDAPDELTRYAEGQKFVGAYVLTTVHDEGAEQKDKDIPIFLTVLAPYKAGLPYDFDQVRVFTWSTKKHHYETAFREKNIEGYLPVSVVKAADPYEKSAVARDALPTFTYKVLAADAAAVVPDPETGLMKPGRLIAKTFRLEGNAVRRVQAPGSAKDEEAHPTAEEKKKDGAKGAKGKKK